MPKSRTIHFFLLSLFTACFFASCTPVNNNNTEVPKQIIEQGNPYASVDKSPLDVSYYPVNYPMLLMSGDTTSRLVARVIYSRPQKNGRTIFGNDPPPKSVQQYGAYWRLGANEASEIEFFISVKIGDKKIAKGRYIIYCIPFENKWTIIFNSNLFSWGLHNDTSKDIVKTDIPVFKTNKTIEFFTMVFQPSPTGADLLMAWDNVKAVLPISF